MHRGYRQEQALWHEVVTMQGLGWVMLGPPIPPNRQATEHRTSETDRPPYRQPLFDQWNCECSEYGFVFVIGPRNTHTCHRDAVAPIEIAPTIETASIQPAFCLSPHFIKESRMPDWTAEEQNSMVVAVLVQDKNPALAWPRCARNWQGVQDAVGSRTVKECR